MSNNTSTAEAPVYTLAEGQPCADPGSAQILRTPRSNGGLVVMSDVQLVETLAHFSRERIPERSVHAKAAGAWGEFEVTHDVSDLTDAKFLTGVGKKTKVLARISTVAGEKGSADTVRDIRGWATKFFTEDGNHDFVFNDLPVFFIRDPIKFPSMNRSHKRHPQTNVPDPNMFWDFHVNNQEGMHALMQLFGQRGIPASLKNINSFGVHTYTLNKEDGSFVYVKFHFKPDAGIATLSAEEGVRLAGEAPDYHVKDLYDTIEGGEHPVWTLFVQVMTPEQAQKSKYDIFDDTFTWSHKDYPLRPVGKLTLKENPHNYFQDIEQAAFSPSNMVPGIGPSADIVLQARMFSYPDAQRYRVGPNYQQLPPNRATAPVYSPYQRDGPGTINGNYGGDPDYVKSEFRKVTISSRHQVPTHEDWAGRVVTFASEVTDRDFEQARDLWQIINEEDSRKDFVKNITETLVGIDEKLLQQVYDMFARVSDDVKDAIEQGVTEAKKGKK